MRKVYLATARVSLEPEEMKQVTIDRKATLRRVIIPANLLAMVWGLVSVMGCAEPPRPAEAPPPVAYDEPPPPPPTVAEPPPEAGIATLSTAFLVGGDIPTETRDAITKQVTQTISDAAPRFRQCYAKHVAKGLSERGEVDVELVLQPGPRFGVLRAGKGTLEDPELIDCTVRAFEQLQFPSPPADYTIIAPIQYRPE